MCADKSKFESNRTASQRASTPERVTATVSQWWIIGGIVLLVLTAYLPVIQGQFVMSDKVVLSGNPRLTADDGLRRIWFSTESEQYEPLLYTSYWLERRVWGLRTWGYHLVNIALHAANAVLVWFLLRRIGVRGAAVAAALFAVHPVNVESVAWIYERKNVLSGLFYFLTFTLLFRFERRRAWRWYGIGLLLFAAALLSKASTVVLPAILLLYWWWRGSPSWSWRNIALSLPFFLLAGLMAALTIWYEHHHIGATGVEYSAGFAERLARAGWYVAFYLGKCFIPYNLMFFYPRWSADPSAVHSYLPHVVMVATLVVLWCKRKTWGRAVLFGLGSYWIALLPVLGFFDIYYHKYSFVADHFQYLALPGLIALFVHVVVCGLDRLGLMEGSLSTSKVKLGGRELALMAVGVCWFLTWQRSQIYQSTRTVCEDTLRRNPESWVAHQVLGQTLLREKSRSREQVLLALEHLERALELKPEEGNTLQLLGRALILLGRDEEALDHVQRSVALYPDHAVFRVNLGALLERRAQLAEAIAEYEEAVRLQPDLHVARVRLGRALLQDGRIDEGISQLREAMRLKPDDPFVTRMLKEAECQRRGAATAPSDPTL